MCHWAAYHRAQLTTVLCVQVPRARLCGLDEPLARQGGHLRSVGRPVLWPAAPTHIEEPQQQRCER